jgi:hypothetical protein
MEKLKCEASFRSINTPRVDPVHQKLKMSFWSINTIAPLNSTLVNTTTVNNDDDVLSEPLPLAKKRIFLIVNRFFIRIHI